LEFGLHLGSGCKTKMSEEPSTSQILKQDIAQAVEPIGDSTINKIVVAIHGIGDQYRYATARSVINIFSRCFDQAAAVPLGSFYGVDSTVQTFRLKAPPEVKPGMADIGFVEVYWADIPRRVQRRGYTIEETKAWARTVVERVRARYEDDLAGLLKKEDYTSAAGVIEEMIDAIGVLGNLLFLAEKAGLFQFRFDDLLTAYVGDVQIVADFANYRERICQHFRKILDEVYNKNKEADIYIVAHSEGTVIALMVLLKALCARTRNLPPPQPPPDWIRKVRGLMTIGSPIDKHLVLWIEMWDPVETPDTTRAPTDLENRIEWRNYYDYGDPVGFKLNTVRDWFKDHGWDKFFEFENKHDFGFARYFLPGKAHNDYWNDPFVFGHFIRGVLKLSPELNGEKFDRPPPSRRWAEFSSYFTPYLLVSLILYTAIYILYTAVNAHLARSESWPSVIRHVGSIGCLLFGTTVASRVPCLTRASSWKWFSAGAFVVFTFFYLLLAAGSLTDLRDLFNSNASIAGPFTALATVSLALASVAFSIWADRHRTFLQRYPPLRLFARGMRPLLIVGGLAAAALVAYRILRTPVASQKSFWPLLLGGAAFIYLWWLAALLFDLAFTWHRYVRHAVWQQYLRQARKHRIEREQQVRKAVASREELHSSQHFPSSQ
jgi:hypothetical protein